MELKSEFPLDKEQLPGYVHRSTKGMEYLKKVQDKSAKRFVFGPVDTNIALPVEGTCPLVALKASILVTIITDGPMSDEDLEYEILLHLKTQIRPLNKLEIRRLFWKEPLPDTKAVNRVLYDMRRRGILAAGKPDLEVGAKPTWTLSQAQINLEGRARDTDGTCSRLDSDNSSTSKRIHFQQKRAREESDLSSSSSSSTSTPPHRPPPKKRTCTSASESSLFSEGSETEGNRVLHESVSESSALPPPMLKPPLRLQLSGQYSNVKRWTRRIDIF
eukprot:1157556-Rhodomonas_salina.1